MCYSLKCYFQNWNGDCQVKDFDKFEKKIGEQSCYVGGALMYEYETKVQIEYDKDRFNLLIKKAYELNLIW